MYAFTPKAPCDASNGPTDTSTKGRRPGLTSMGSCNILCDEPPVGAAQDHSDHTNTFLWYLAALASERNRWLPSHMANLESMLVQCGWFESASSIFKGSPLPVAVFHCRFLHYPLLLLPLAHPWGASPEFWGRATSFGMTPYHPWKNPCQPLRDTLQAPELYTDYTDILWRDGCRKPLVNPPSLEAGETHISPLRCIHVNVQCSGHGIYYICYICI